MGRSTRTVRTTQSRPCLFSLLRPPSAKLSSIATETASSVGQLARHGDVIIICISGIIIAIVTSITIIIIIIIVSLLLSYCIIFALILIISIIILILILILLLLSTPYPPAALAGDCRTTVSRLAPHPGPMILTMSMTFIQLHRPNSLHRRLHGPMLMSNAFTYAQIVKQTPGERWDTLNT